MGRGRKNSSERARDLQDENLEFEFGGVRWSA